MARPALLLLLSATVFAQKPSLADAARSPLALESFIHNQLPLEWNALWTALGIADPQYPPCGITENDTCSTDLITVSNPDQTILIIEGGPKRSDVYLRYLRKPSGGWTFAGALRSYVSQYPRRHEFWKWNEKPFLRISSDHSQVGVAQQQEVEDWFDLTRPDFTPVFTFTPQGSLSPFSFAVSRDIRSQVVVSTPGTIELSLEVNFGGPKMDFPAKYIGVYERDAGEKKFTLRHAYSDQARNATIPNQDFEGIMNLDSGFSNERLLHHALPGLQKIAAGSDKDAKEWLNFVLSYARDCPEKRTLLNQLETNK